MSTKTAVLALVVSVVLMGCQKKQDDAASPVVSADAPAAVASETATAADIAKTEDVSPRGSKISERDGVAMAVAMTASVELCGLSKPAESQAALAKIAAEAKEISAAEINTIYTSAKLQGKAVAAKDPAKFESDCAELRKMGDPAEIKKMEAAAKELEAWAKKMDVKAQ